MNKERRKQSAKRHLQKLDRQRAKRKKRGHTPKPVTTAEVASWIADILSARAQRWKRERDERRREKGVVVHEKS